MSPLARVQAPPNVPLAKDCSMSRSFEEMIDRTSMSRNEAQDSPVGPTTLSRDGVPSAHRDSPQATFQVTFSTESGNRALIHLRSRSGV